MVRRAEVKGADTSGGDSAAQSPEVQSSKVQSSKVQSSEVQLPEVQLPEVQPRPCVVLTGPPGSGKTTVGRTLAVVLGVELRDTDDAIEMQQGRSISDIFLDEGESRFRELEQAEVASALASHGGVLSLGGGAVMDPQTQAALAGHTVVFLDVGIADAARRVGFNQSRPLLAMNPRAQWTAMMDLRRPTYERLATMAVLTTGRTPQDIAAEIVQRLEQPGSGQPGPESEGTGEARE